MNTPYSSVALGAAVRRARKAAGLRQDELAGVAGVGTRFVVDLERGKASVQMDSVCAVLSALGMQLYFDEPVP